MEIVKYNVNEAEIAKMSDIYMHLTIRGLDDKEGLESVHSARMVMVKHRGEVNKLRKKTNEDAQAFIKNNNSNAKKLLALMEPIETHLKSEEDKITQEKKRIEAEKETAEKLRIQKRVDVLLSVNVVMPYFDVAMLSNAEYSLIYEDAKTAYEVEQHRLEKERKATEAEIKKLAVERAEIESIKKEQEAKAKVQQEKEKALQAERNQIEDIKRVEEERKNKEAFEKKAAEEAKIQAEKDAQAKTEREEKEKAERLIAEKAETERQELLRPIKDRIYDYADDILKETPPTFKGSKKATGLIRWAVSELKDLSARIKLKADVL